MKAGICLTLVTMIDNGVCDIVEINGGHKNILSSISCPGPVTGPVFNPHHTFYANFIQGPDFIFHVSPVGSHSRQVRE